MKPPKALALTRREFVEVGAAAGAGLVLGFYLPSRAASPASGTPFAPNAFTLYTTPEAPACLATGRPRADEATF